MKWILLLFFFSIRCMDKQTKKTRKQRALAALLSLRKTQVMQRQEVSILCNQHMEQIQDLAGEHFVIVQNQEETLKELDTLLGNQKLIMQCNSIICACMFTCVLCFFTRLLL